MRTLRFGLLIAVAASCAMAQRHGGGFGGMRGGGIGVGVGVGRGPVGRPVFGGVGVGRPIFGGFHGGFIHPGFVHRGFGFRAGFFGGVWPFAWPFNGGFGYSPLFSDFGYSDYSGYSYPPYSYAPSPNVTVVYPAPAAPATVTMVEPARPVIRDYTNGNYGLPEESKSSTEQPIYLIAFKDQVIRPAIAYWVDGETLHYVTLRHEQKQAPLDSVDRALSTQLNRERRVPFRLPE